MRNFLRPRSGKEIYPRPMIKSYMDVRSLPVEDFCLHLEKRVVERRSKGISFDRRPDLVLWICHFPLPSLSGIQCQVVAGSGRCPHHGPYGYN